MKTILVTGSTGQLGNELLQLSHLEKDYRFEFVDRSQLNLASEESVRDFFTNKTSSDYLSIINAAAYTAVDLAEKDKHSAELVNVDGPRNLAQYAKSIGAKLIHVSTDFVFDGNHSRPYNETDLKNPISVYGKTKSDGEDSVLEVNPDSIILRTSWVYSQFGKNFFNTIARLSKEKESLRVVADQIGSPTWAGDLARVCFSAAISDQSGIFHFSNEGVASWYDFAYEIVRAFGYHCEVIPIATEEYPTDAKRPAYSVLNKQKFRKTFEVQNVHWKERLYRLVEEVKGQKLT
ncbi:dTDP-4-dehydrorhamnose reductase [Leptospira perdikensis]|uniref:dTDP-4-dehydrorhamnose reductase n=1 Tax=Leptospira perdikensis TaxID=2484948 RepID=A0A4R9JDY5_9LEPT|nr:dTDP-4-dehydrorhamnose reductase [Leptospira perdikensis]TGL37134.1 dTDP-4-dehydrorhamnose reductase [Leptospira perdikensis]